MLNSGEVDLQVLRKLLGQVKIETTMKYVDLIETNTARQYHAAMELIHGGDMAVRGPVRMTGKARKDNRAAQTSRQSGRSRRKAAVSDRQPGRRHAA